MDERAGPGTRRRAPTVRCPHCGTANRLPAAAEGTPRCGSCHTALPWITSAGDADFAAVAERASLPVLVDLWATWCGPCRQVTPDLERLAAELAGRVKLVAVDIDTAPRLARRFAVQAVPTLLVLHHGQAVARQTGAAPREVLRTWLTDALATRARPATGPGGTASGGTGSAGPPSNGEPTNGKPTKGAPSKGTRSNGTTTGGDR